MDIMNKKPEGGRIPPGKQWWALLIAFTVVIAALFYSLWLVKPDALAKLSGY